MTASAMPSWASPTNKSRRSQAVNTGPSRSTEVDLDPVEQAALGQRAEQRLPALALMEGRVDQVHPERPSASPCACARAVPHVDVEHDLVRLAVRPLLELDPHPAVTFVGAGVVAGPRSVSAYAIEAARGPPALVKLTSWSLRPQIATRASPRAAACET
jgi:hypothetical protein